MGSRSPTRRSFDSHAHSLNLGSRYELGVSNLAFELRHEKERQHERVEVAELTLRTARLQNAQEQDR